jgi:hypothetical protein
MIYVECPNKVKETKLSLFLAGGIHNCRAWQKDIISILHPLDIILYNPRREKFDISNPKMTEEQITWEEEMIRKADVVSFYFCKETECPITLYEMGNCVMMDKPILIGMDRDYSRRKDVEIQIKLKRPEIQIVYGVTNLADSIKKLFTKKLRVPDYDTA